MNNRTLLAMAIGLTIAQHLPAQNTPLYVQVGYATHEASGGGDQNSKKVDVQSINQLGMRIANVTGFSWKVVGKVADNNAALVRVKWYRGEVQLMDGVLTLPDQLGGEASFNLAPTAGLYKVELWVSPRQDVREELAHSVAFEVEATAAEPGEFFADLRETAQQREEEWRWKWEQVRVYTVARFLPSCNLEKIRYAYRQIEPLMIKAETQWREYHTAKVQRLNDEQNKQPDRLSNEKEKGDIYKRELENIILQFKNARDIRDIQIKYGLDTKNSDLLIAGLEGDRKREEGLIAHNMEFIKELEAQETQMELDKAQAKRDLDAVISTATFDRYTLSEELRGYERKCPR